MINNKWFTFDGEIINVKISADVSAITLHDITELQNELEKYLPEECRTTIEDETMYFVDPYGDRYPISDGFACNIY